jgi:NAD(P)-dependent dehydrogenase (short-subunit alcohol dehydrogenase family)
VGEFESKGVIVTGGSLGIGKGIVLEFARLRAKVAIADVNGEAGAALAAEAGSLPGEAIFIQADVAKADECARVVSEAAGAFGRVDVLVNNVGIQPLDSYRNVEDTSEEMWDRILDVNLKSAFLMSKYAIPEIRKQGGGAIVSTASVQGLQSQTLVPAYAASKGGILSLTRQMALDYARENIRVLAVCPGTIDTAMVRTAAEAQAGDPDKTIQTWGRLHPLGRVGTPLDIANVVVFLASEKASFMTGEHVCVDGGFNALGTWGVGAFTD